MREPWSNCSGFSGNRRLRQARLLPAYHGGRSHKPKLKRMQLRGFMLMGSGGYGLGGSSGSESLKPKTCRFEDFRVRDCRLDTQKESKIECTRLVFLATADRQSRTLKQTNDPQPPAVKLKLRFISTDHADPRKRTHPHHYKRNAHRKVLGKNPAPSPAGQKVPESPPKKNPTPPKS